MESRNFKWKKLKEGPLRSRGLIRLGECGTLIPWEQSTIDRSSQLPVNRCISSLSPAA